MKDFELRNPVYLTGNIGKDPEKRVTPGKDSVVNFNLATYANKDKNTGETTAWIKCTAWRDLADFIAERFKQGNTVLVGGKFDCEPNLYETKGGDTKASYQFTVYEIYPVSRTTTYEMQPDLTAEAINQGGKLVGTETK